MAKVLVAEDDSNTADMLRDWLEAHHYSIDLAVTGEDAMSFAIAFDYDLVILDWDLPRASGLEVLKAIRAAGKTSPVLMLTGKGRVDEKEVCFEAGADDYLTKPFNLRELLARVRALIRRSSASAGSSVLTIKHLTLDTVARKLTIDGVEIELALREYDLLEFLMRNPGQVFSPDALLARVWPSESDATAMSVRSCMKKLRKKIDSPDGESMIKNLHGVGYRMEKD